jgi:uroporphyrinogen decarboxylase
MNYLFNERKILNGKHQVPVWFMRQAGRYHKHYQNLKTKNDFMTLCKDPQLACEVTLGPIEDFKFDAAILFSDLLFPLDHLGMNLSYESGPPTLGFHLHDSNDLKKLKIQASAEDFYAFQTQATTLLKEKLPKDKALIGFVGAPFTLYTYAVEGSHAGQLVSAKKGFYDGRFQAFYDLLFPSLLSEMISQAKAGADAIALFDTAAGELSPEDYQEFIMPKLLELMNAFKLKCNAKIIYYSKHTQPVFFKMIANLPIDVVGVDWRCDLVEVSKLFPKNVYLQGNIDPAWLHLPWNILEVKLKNYFNHLRTNHFPFERWIAGLGHGVLIKTPEENVRKTVELIHEYFLY